MNEISPSMRALDDARHVRTWLERFQTALNRQDRTALDELFAKDSHWRDLLGLTWSITPHEGRESVVAALLRHGAEAGEVAFELAEERTPPRRVARQGTASIEAIIAFRTARGRGHGVLRLLADDPGKAWLITTSLEEIEGHEEPVGARRPEGSAFSRMFGGKNWSDNRRDEEAFEGRDPQVLIIGAGQAGLSVAARLKLLSVDALVVDRNPRVGDVWRNRYHSLALHNKVGLNHMAYLPFPPGWPEFLPKDMIAGWLETYAWAMQCNVWTSTTFEGAEFDARARNWTARVTRPDGSKRVLRPRHIVFANGVAGKPLMPDLPGLRDFAGTLQHTHQFQDGGPWAGKRALVIGAGTSGHDVAQDLASHGCDVTLVQRGSTTVASVKAAGLVHSVYYGENLPLEDADLVGASSTYPLLVRGYQLAVKKMKEIDADLLAGLQARGFKLDYGPDETGHQMKFRRRHGGYYLNCGCSEMIIEGKVGLMQHDEIDRFVPDGALLTDGSVHKADLIVTATGYQSQQEVVRELLGNEIAERVGPVWGLAEDGELANMYRPTAQQGLWFIGGGFAHARIYSRYIALGIKAQELGLLGDVGTGLPSEAGA